MTRKRRQKRQKRAVPLPPLLRSRTTELPLVVVAAAAAAAGAAAGGSGGRCDDQRPAKRRKRSAAAPAANADAARADGELASAVLTEPAELAQPLVRPVPASAAATAAATANTGRIPSSKKRRRTDLDPTSAAAVAVADASEVLPASTRRPDQWIFFKCRVTADDDKAKLADGRYFSAFVQLAVRGLLGIVGLSRPLKTLHFDEARQEGWLRMRARDVRLTWAALTMARRFEDHFWRVDALQLTTSPPPDIEDCGSEAGVGDEATDDIIDRFAAGPELEEAEA
ncbi:hypothetical protein HK405_008388 [Cladochytrium tenue]|nr:hypothetical protein HK405_008388 [Cladochytrium tenue]